LNPKEVRLYRYRAEAHYSRKDYDQAIADFTQAIELSPQDDVSYYNRGLAYYNKGELDPAIADWEMALQINPNYSSARNNLTIAQREKTEAEQKLAREAADKYDPAKFILVPSNFKPSDYQSKDLFEAAAAAERLTASLPSEVDVFGFSSARFVSDLVFISQSGLDIRFRTADNAISQTMKIDSRSGLQAGQRVRVYYRVSKRPYIEWNVEAIERL
jgi:tetratricopeptide (TPR) repeat protein